MRRLLRSLRGAYRCAKFVWETDHYYGDACGVVMFQVSKAAWNAVDDKSRGRLPDHREAKQLVMDMGGILLRMVHGYGVSDTPIQQWWVKETSSGLEGWACAGEGPV